MAAPALAIGIDHRLAGSFARRLTQGWRGQYLLFLFAYLVYSAGRWAFVGDLDTATANAHGIVDLERSLGVFVERPIQETFQAGAVVWALNKIYLAAQLAVLPGALVWVYRANRAIYRRLRDTVLATWMLSLPIYALFPVAPPRLAGVGIADTMADGHQSAMTGRLATKFFNPLAAVPSLHTGFAFAVGIALAYALKRRWAKAIALLWGPLIALTVMATGNHFVFDVAAGIGVTVLGYGVARVSSSRSPRGSLAPALAAGIVVMSRMLRRRVRDAPPAAEAELVTAC